MRGSRRVPSGLRGGWIAAVFVAVVLGVVVLGVGARAQAQQAQEDQDRELRLPERSGYVSDHAGVLGEDVEGVLEAMLARLHRVYGVEVYVLTVATVAPLRAYEYAVEVFERWGLEKSRVDRSTLLFLIAVEDEQAHIAVSQGMAALLPDPQQVEMLRAALPSLAAGDFEGGVLEGVRWLKDYLEERAAPASERGAEAPEEAVGVRLEDLIGIVLIVVGLALIVLAGRVLSE